MSTLIFADAAYPPGPTGKDGIALYIGGDTPHVATHAEWAARHERYRLTIWTRSNPQGHAQGVKEGAQAAAAARALGQPKGTRIMLDFEGAVDGGYVQGFDQSVKAAGYLTVLYGSRSAVLQNPKPSGGYFDAQWNGIAHLNAGSVGTQYISDQMLGRPYDLSVVVNDGKWWDTHAQTPTPPPPVHPPVPVPVHPPVPVPAPQPQNTYEWRAKHNSYTPLADDGDFGAGTVKALQYVVGAHVDGSWGDVSRAALSTMLGIHGQPWTDTVRALQYRVGAGQDGSWGRETTLKLQEALNLGNLW